MPKSQLQPTRQGSAPSTPMRVEMDTLTQGMSQQPEHLRVMGQCTEQINGWSSTVEGLTKRNPARFQARIFNSALENFYLEMFQISRTEIYSVLISATDGDDLEMRILRAGTQVVPQVHGTGLAVDGDGTITISDTAYLWAEQEIDDEPRLYDSFCLINSGPLGLLLNRTQETAMDADTTAARTEEGLIFVSAVAYNVSYTVTLTHDGTATTLTPVTTPQADADDNQISTSGVAEDLADLINAEAGWTAIQSDYVVIVSRDDGTAFELQIDDSRSNNLAVAFTDEISSLRELPNRASDGYKVNFTSDPTTTLDDRWLEFNTFDDTANGEGSWQETVAPGIEYRIDSNTMPFVLRREGLDDLHLGPADGTQPNDYQFPQWGDRTAGDETSVPNPDFVGVTLRDHCFYNQRYVVTGGEIVSFSETDDIFNFFADSAAALVETDAFHLRCTSEVSSATEWLLPIDESLLIWSRTSQFQARPVDGEVISPSTSVVVRLSNIEMNPHVRPKLAAAKVLFATDEYGYTHFREYEFFNSRNQRLGLNLGGSSDILANLPKFIRGMVTHWDVGEAVDFAVARTPEHPNKLYVYKYKWTSTGAGLQKQQASWSEWQLGGEVQWCKFMENRLWLLVSYDDRTDFLQIFADELEDEDEGLQIHLDRLLLYPECNAPGNTTNDITATYDEDTDRTTFVLPYTPTGKAIAVIRFINDDHQGVVLGDTETDTLVCDLKGDWTDESIAFGEEYEFKYEFTKAFKPTRDAQNQRLIGDLSGRTQIHTWTCHHSKTGFYQVRVKRDNRSEDSVTKFRAVKLNVENNQLDEETNFVNTGKMRVPIYSRNLNCRVIVESTSHLPLVLTGAEWEGSYSNRTR